MDKCVNSWIWHQCLSGTRVRKICEKYTNATENANGIMRKKRIFWYVPNSPMCGKMSSKSIFGDIVSTVDRRIELFNVEVFIMVFSIFGGSFPAGVAMCACDAVVSVCIGLNWSSSWCISSFTNASFVYWFGLFVSSLPLSLDIRTIGPTVSGVGAIVISFTAQTHSQTLALPLKYSRWSILFLVYSTELKSITEQPNRLLNNYFAFDFGQTVLHLFVSVKMFIYELPFSIHGSIYVLLLFVRCKLF